MTDVLCPVCQRREPADGATVCGTCRGRILDDLARIAEVTRLAAGWLNPASSPGGGTSRPVPGSRPPLNTYALDASCGHDVLPVLESWVRLVREEAGLVPWGVATEGRAVTVDALVAFLRSWLAWITERADFPVEDLAREVRDLRWQLEALDPDRDKPGTRFPCQQPHPDADGRTCDYRLVLDMTRPAEDVHCPRCGHDTTAGRVVLAALLEPSVSVWVYVDVITGTLPVKAATLRQWVKRGHVQRNGNRYDIGAVYRRHMAGDSEVAEL